MRQFINISKRVYKITFKIIITKVYPKLFFPTCVLTRCDTRSELEERVVTNFSRDSRCRFDRGISRQIPPMLITTDYLSLLTARSAPSPSFVRSLSTRHLACYRRNTVCTLKATLSIPRSAR